MFHRGSWSIRRVLQPAWWRVLLLLGFLTWLWPLGVALALVAMAVLVLVLSVWLAIWAWAWAGRSDRGPG